jgi:hypothetical protein
VFFLGNPEDLAGSKEWFLVVFGEIWRILLSCRLLGVLFGHSDDEGFDEMLDSTNLPDTCKNIYVAVSVFAQENLSPSIPFGSKKGKGVQDRGLLYKFRSVMTRMVLHSCNLAFGVRNNEESIPLEKFVDHSKHIPLPRSSFTMT